MKQNHLGDLGPYGKHGIEGSHGFLEDHGDLVAPDGTHLLNIPFEQITSLEQDTSLDYLSRRIRDQTEYGEGKNGLAASRFPDDTECMSCLQFQVYSVNRLYNTSGVKKEYEVLRSRSLSPESLQDDVPGSDWLSFAAFTAYPDKISA
jgi:hypothetical protein